jgi:hypothetical protein
MIYSYEKLCNAQTLQKEIYESTITVALVGVTVSNETKIEFKAEISTAEKSTLDDLVDAHDASVLPEQIPMAVKIPETLPVIQLPFAAKRTQSGLRLFRRLHGITASLAAGSNEIAFTCPYDHAKITGLEVINCEALDTANFEVFDTPTGTYSGIPDLKLNQFAFDVVLKKDHHAHVCHYDSDLFKDLVVKITYQSLSAKTIGVNFFLDEVKE